MLRFFCTLSIVVFFNFISNQLFSQTPCNLDLNIAPGQGCSVAPFVCDLDGYCANMQPGSWGGDASFCGGGFTLQNPNWFAFVANSNVIDIHIYFSGCEGGN